MDPADDDDAGLVVDGVSLGEDRRAEADEATWEALGGGPKPKPKPKPKIKPKPKPKPKGPEPEPEPELKP